MAKYFSVKVPATSANIGSGFDCIGIALSLYNTFTFDFSSSNLKFSGFALEHANEDNLVLKTFNKILVKYNHQTTNKLHLIGDINIPVSRGLGSSSTCIIAGILAANEYGDLNLSKDTMLLEAALIEGHPDNVAPALLGGLVTAVQEPNLIFHQKHQVSADLIFDVFIGQDELETKKAREVLPLELSYHQAIYNISRASMLVNAFSTGNEQHLKICTQDAIHQVYRLPLIEQHLIIKDFIKKNNYLTYWISGAGSSIVGLRNKHVVTSTKTLNIKTLDVDYEGSIIIYESRK